jgi:hypothetical protein
VTPHKVSLGDGVHYGRGLFVVSEAVEYNGEDCQRVVQEGDAAGVVVAALARSLVVSMEHPHGCPDGCIVLR